MTAQPERITLLAGGVGGAKMAEGLAVSRFGDKLSIIGNIADDDEFHGLWVSPDIDTLMYTLAGVVDREQGWGLASDSFHTLEALTRLGAETWMRLGDLDFATHILRSQLWRQGQRPSRIVQYLASRLGVQTPILLPTDARLRTRLNTDMGWLSFQEYFVRERCRPTIQALDIAGAENAEATPEARAAIRDADLIIIAPSNPIVSIGPILAVPDIFSELRASSARKIAVSPLIGGHPLKGPADRMLRAQGFIADPLGLADFYAELIDALVIDHTDAVYAQSLQARGLEVFLENIVMQDLTDKISLAEAIVFRSSKRAT